MTTVDRRSPGLVNPALARLGMGAAAVRRVEADRPWLVVQALLTGADPQQVIETLGWDLTELRFAVNRWATKLQAQGLITDGQAAAVLAILYGGR